MATCPFCNGFRDDTYECACLAEWQRDCEEGRGPSGFISGAFTYMAWRRVRQVEQTLQLHPEFGEDWAQEKIAEIAAEENAHRQKVLDRIAAEERRKQALRNNPRRRLY